MAFLEQRSYKTVKKKIGRERQDENMKCGGRAKQQDMGVIAKICDLPLTLNCGVGGKDTGSLNMGASTTKQRIMGIVVL